MHTHGGLIAFYILKEIRCLHKFPLHKPQACYAISVHNRSSKKEQTDAAEMLQWVSGVLTRKYAQPSAARADLLASTLKELVVVSK